MNKIGIITGPMLYHLGYGGDMDMDMVRMDKMGIITGTIFFILLFIYSVVTLAFILGGSNADEKEIFSYMWFTILIIGWAAFLFQINYYF